MLKNKLITPIIIILLAFMGCSASDKNSIVYIDSSNEIMYEVYAFIPYGDTEETLGSFGTIGIKQELLGPKSFAVSDNGDIYILDTINDKIKIYNVDAEYISSFDLPEMCEGIDMEILNDTIYVMCDGEGDYIYSTTLSSNNSNNEDITWSRLTYYSILNSKGLYRDNNHVYIVTHNGKDVCLTGSDEPDASRTIIYELNEEEKECHITKDDSTNIVSYYAEPLGMYYIKSNQEYTYILESEGLLKYYPYAEERIGKYKNGIKIETALGLPMEKSYTFSMPFKRLYITDEGTVYQMDTSESGITIYIVPWHKGHLTRITEEMILLNEKKNPE